MLYRLEKIKRKKMSKKKLILVVLCILTFIVIIIFGGIKYNQYLNKEKNKAKNKSDSGSIVNIIGNNIQGIGSEKLFGEILTELDAVNVSEAKGIKKEKLDAEILFSTVMEQELEREDKSDRVSYRNAVNVEEAYKNDGKKNAFLTFDDGPSKAVTPDILNILDKYNVKATFFVVGAMAEANKELLLKEYKCGHAIANHSYTHNYNKLYANIDNFKEELDKTNKVFKEVLGEDFNTRIFRFPGGGFERYKNPFKSYLANNGYKYIDWNALNGDAEGVDRSVDALVQRVKDTVYGNEDVVILMHDAPAKKNTALSLPRVIEYLKEQGYEFKILK